jgi:FMN-dependent oxidoreductase (nitrilotriacetate monooxygenase family)
MAQKPFHLGWFLAGSHAQAWGLPWSGDNGKNWAKPDLYVDLVRAMERACLDYVLLEDHAHIFDRYQSSMALPLAHAVSSPRLDPLLLSAVIATATSRIGIVPTVNMFTAAPYHTARQIGTLDQLANGRAGWNMVTGSSDRAAQNYGLDKMFEHDKRYDMATEYITIVNGLWDGWEPDAILADPESGVFADHRKVHRLDYRGEYFSSRGPLNSGPAVQGRPVMAQAGNSEAGRSVGAAFADTIVAAEDSVEKMKAFRDDIRSRMVSVGRNPDDCKVMFLTSVLLGASADEVAAKIAQREARIAARAEISIAMLSSFADIDFGDFPLDEPLGERAFEFNGPKNVVGRFVELNRGRTLREAGIETGRQYQEHGLSGTPEYVAARMAEIMQEVGGDGFLFAGSSVTRRDVAEVTDGLVPELQRRGLVRTEYSSVQFRDNLREF